MRNSFSTPWLILTVICLVFLVAGFRIALKKTSLDKSKQNRILCYFISGIIIWTASLLALSLNGFFRDFSQFPPRVTLALLIPLPVVLYFAMSRAGKQILESIPTHWFIYMQSFRIAVELLLLIAFLNGKIPIQMSLEGRNFDIITGLLALPVGYMVAKRKPYSRKLAIFFNILGLVLLINILVIAILSMPTPYRYFMNDPANTIVAEFPFILLPGVLVPLAYSMHIFSLRKLWSGHLVIPSNPIEKAKSYS